MLIAHVPSPASVVLLAESGPAGGKQNRSKNKHSAPAAAAITGTGKYF
jgi:hypothetical protein